VARSDRKKKLYDLGKESLGRLLRREVPGYLCPICLQGFERLDDLTEEDVPPRAIGGQVLCLTCRGCNCGAGHGIDAEVHREKLSRSFLAVDGQSRRAKIVVGCLQANIDLRRDEKGFHIRVLGPQNDPKGVERLKAALAGVVQSRSSLKLRDSVSYSRRDADAGYLKSAYLAAFAKLGYTYILRAALNRVRQQIRDRTCRALETVRVFSGDFSVLEKAFFLFHEPVCCMGVKIRDSVSCLPLPDGDDSFYEELTRLRTTGAKQIWRANGTIRWPDRLELALDFPEAGDSGDRSLSP
jgi:hypothetical protein